jgi:DNA-binding NarL/FixJ family response regulator
MKKSPFRILLVGIFSENSKELIPILKKNDFVIDTAEVLESAIQRITNEETDLVISSKKLNGFYGFEVYNQLKPNLLNAGIPFFMVLDEYEKEDVLIGLEMGIDNFLFSPFIESVVIHAIENWLKKKRDINLFETEAFKHYFYTTSVAMFFNSDGKISLVNEAFCHLIGICSNQFLGTPVNELFLLEENETNRMNYRRFKIGADSECQLTNVRWYKNQEATYNITFYKGKAKGTNNVFAEIVASFLPARKLEKEITNRELMKVNGQPVDRKEKIKCLIKLTARERQVYLLSAQGLALKQIAGELNLSQRTVEKHRANIMHKTKTTSFIETMAKIGHSLNNISD